MSNGNNNGNPGKPAGNGGNGNGAHSSHLDDTAANHPTQASPQPPLEVRIGQVMRDRGLSVCAAESCTGGLILHRLTNVPGSSAYVMGGFVTYSNEAKVKFARVSKKTLMRHGAVSEETALEMAMGVRAAFGTDLALSVTGIAGPGGGTDHKPVGLTYIALGSPSGERVVRYVWTGDRESNKQQSAEAALKLLYDYLTSSSR
ncbi:MAG TPA: CinA family protein [Aggregatilineales bacterium]|nr:CinA family protein [Aggregatilineales bacterium]